MLYTLIKNTLSFLDPERAQEITLKQLKRIYDTPLKWLVSQSVPTKTVNCMGISFKNPIGLAAGLDKNGNYIDVLGSMGFGFIEIGTVTPNAQQCNEKPRLFHISKADGLINRMGLNNQGVDNLVENVKHSNFSGILGISIGKNQSTPFEHSKDDYLMCMEKVYPYASYIAVNISSFDAPNSYVTQFDEALNSLLVSIKTKQIELQQFHHKYVPLAIKISPDMGVSELSKFADILIRNNIDGLIATDTTSSRELVHGLEYSTQKGGLSGRPLQLRSTEVIRQLFTELKGKIPIIGVGGVDSLIAAREKLAAGASLIQIYSGFIFHGPRLIKNIISYI